MPLHTLEQPVGRVCGRIRGGAGVLLEAELRLQGAAAGYRCAQDGVRCRSAEGCEGEVAHILIPQRAAGLGHFAEDHRGLGRKGAGDTGAAQDVESAAVDQGGAAGQAGHSGAAHHEPGREGGAQFREGVLGIRGNQQGVHIQRHDAQ